MRIWVVIILVAGVGIIGLTVLLNFTRILRAYLNRQIDKFVKKLFTEPYTKNLWEGVTALRHFGVQWMLENELRSHTPSVLEKPLGTHRPFPHFDGLLFVGAQLHRRPLDITSAVNTTTVIGKKAKHPLEISLPLMTSAMGYGVALNKSFARALCKGTAMADTACNTGQGPVLSDQLELAKHLIMQYHGAPWCAPDEILAQADMLEIRFGQGANAGSGTLVPMNSLSEQAVQDMNLTGSGSQDVHYIPAAIPSYHRPHDLLHLVNKFRDLTDGVPIAIKLAASNHLELDLKIAVRAGVDVIVLDGAQGGTHGSPAILVDDFGLPTLTALCRAVTFLENVGMRDKIDIIVSGGMRTPGDVLKAVTLGATAVYMGSGALFATTHTQITKPLPFEPPTQLAWINGPYREDFDEDEGAQSLANFLASTADELRFAIRALGKRSIHELNREDLVAWDADVARVTNLPLV